MTGGGADETQAEPVIDPDQVDMLRSLGPSDGPGGLADLVGTFIAEVRHMVVRVEEAAVARDAAAVAYAAHNMKGAALMFGARRVAAGAAELEQAGNVGRLESVMPLVTRIQADLLDFATALRQLERPPTRGQ